MLKISVALAIAVILCFLFYWTYYFCKTQSRSKALNRKASRTKIREPDENINAGNFRKNGNKNLLLPPNFHRSLSSLHRISSSRSSRCRGKSRLQVDIKNVSKMNSSSSENLYGFSSLNDDQRAKSWLTLYNSSKSNKESTEGASWRDFSRYFFSVLLYLSKMKKSPWAHRTSTNRMNEVKQYHCKASVFRQEKQWNLL